MGDIIIIRNLVGVDLNTFFLFQLFIITVYTNMLWMFLSSFCHFSFFFFLLRGRFLMCTKLFAAFLHVWKQCKCSEGGGRREDGWYIHTCIICPLLLRTCNNDQWADPVGEGDYFRADTYTQTYNEVTAKGTLSIAITSEEVMTPSPGIPLPAVLWHHQDQEVSVCV